MGNLSNVESGEQGWGEGRLRRRERQAFHLGRSSKTASKAPEAWQDGVRPQALGKNCTAAQNRKRNESGDPVTRIQAHGLETGQQVRARSLEFAATPG